MSLPLVNIELFSGKLASLRGDKDYTRNMKSLVRVDNPCLWMLVESIQQNDKFSDDFKAGFMTGVCQIYDLLYTQNVVDELSS